MKQFDLKCVTCGKVCGYVGIPDDSPIKLEDLAKEYTTRCDDHKDAK